MRFKTQMHLAASRLHKWLALIIGAQLLIWFASGALMSFLPIEEVRGEHLVDAVSVTMIPPESQLVSPGLLITNAGAPVEMIAFRMVDGYPVAEVTTNDRILQFDAATGVGMPPINAETATRIAHNAWTGPGKPASSATFVTEPSPEYRDVLPAWRITFVDPDETSVFVAANTGRITAVRSGTWRLYDFFWSLHIMDWTNHENFNSWWLLAFAIGGLVLGIAGTVLLILRWPIRKARRHG